MTMPNKGTIFSIGVLVLFALIIAGLFFVPGLSDANRATLQVILPLLGGALVKATDHAFGDDDKLPPGAVQAPRPPSPNP